MVSKGRLGLQKFVEVTATAPAKIYNLHPRKGSIAIGADADIVVWDPKRQVTLADSMMHDGARYTPYAGRTVTGWPVTVMRRGEVIVSDGKLTAKPGSGSLAAARRRPRGRPARPPHRRHGSRAQLRRQAALRTVVIPGCRSVPPPASKVDLRREEGETVRPRFGPASAGLSAYSTGGPSRWTHPVGVIGGARDRHPHLGTPSNLARLSAALPSVEVGELSPWRSVLPSSCRRRCLRHRGRQKSACRNDSATLGSTLMTNMTPLTTAPKHGHATLPVLGARD